MNASCSLLIVDDNDSHRLLVRHALAGTSFTHIFESATLAQAISIIELNRIDLVVLDLNLDHESGLTLLTWLRTQQSLAIKVIIISTSRLASDLKRCRLEGAHDYIPKSDSPEVFALELQQSVAKILAYR